MTDPADDLLHYIDASPSPSHAVAETARRLQEAGWRALDETDPWSLEPGDRVYTIRGDSSIAAFVLGTAPPSEAGFRLVGAHTDSPNLRVRPNPERTREGYHQLAVDAYGGVLLHTWLDRDLSLAGRVVVQQDGGAETRSVLVDLRRPVMRAANLAIHLNRNVNTEGLVVDPQKHVHPIVGLESDGSFDLRELLAAEVSHAGTSVAPSQVLGWELSAYDVQPSTRAGLRGEMLHAPRLDNLGSCHAATTALIATADSGPEATTGMVLYDHEECGSRSARGAFSPFMRTVLDRVLAARGDREPDAFPRAVARSFLVSADMAHAIHPNYADRHDSEHSPVLGGGPVLKLNVNQAYATDARAWSRFEALCRASDVTPQRFVNRGDMPCGTTIGPITASELGMETVDVGNPMLSMHSCREMAAAADVPRMIAVLQKHFNS